MFSSIYAIFWEKQDLVYIGRSKNLNARLAKHLSLLEEGSHYNHKLQKAFDTFGKYTKIEVLETVAEDLSNSREMYWIHEFNSVEDGLNLIGGLIPRGIETVVDLEVVEDASLYKFILVAPDNTIHKFNNITEFIKTRPDLANKGPHMANALRKMYRGGTKSCHGYRKYNGNNTYTPNPRAHSYTIEYNGVCTEVVNLAAFCREYALFKDNWYAAADALRATSIGRYREYKGHKCRRNKAP